MCEACQLDFREALNSLYLAHLSAPSILREHEVRAPERNSGQNTNTGIQTDPRAALLGNIGDVPQTALPTIEAINFTLPTHDFDPAYYAYTGLSQDDLASIGIGIGKPRKKTFIEEYLLSKERQKRDLAGWERLQNGVDAETAHEVLNAIQALMEGRKIKHFGGLVGCCVHPLPQLEKGENGKGKKVIGFDGKAVLSPSAIHKHNHDGELSYSMIGLQSCSSPMKCPVCSRKITYYRRLQISWGVWLLLEDNKNYVMMTLTAPHTVNTNPIDFVNSFCEAKRNFMKSAKWKKIMKKFKYFGIISGNEITVDAPWSNKKSGMHFHSHCLLLFDRTKLNSEEIKELEEELSTAWTEECEKVGLVTPATREAHRIYGLDISQNENDASDTASSKAANYIAKEVSFEVAAAPGAKAARRPDRLNQWQLMLLATTTHPELIPDLDNVLIALNKRHLTDWTKKIQSQYAIPTVKQIKAIFDGSDLEEVLAQNIKIAQQICGETPDITIPATLDDADTGPLESLEPEKEHESIDFIDESEENEEIMEGKAGEEVLQISFVDAAYIAYYGAKSKLLKSLPKYNESGEEYTLSDVAECAKIAIQLISKGIDPNTFEKMKPKRSSLLRLMSNAKENEFRREIAGYENPVSWSSQLPLFDLSEINL